VAFERVLDARLGRGRERRRVGVLHRRDGCVPHLLAGEQRRLERSVVVVGAADGAQPVDRVRSRDPRDLRRCRCGEECRRGPVEGREERGTRCERARFGVFSLAVRNGFRDPDDELADEDILWVD